MGAGRGVGGRESLVEWLWGERLGWMEEQVGYRWGFMGLHHLSSRYGIPG